MVSRWLIVKESGMTMRPPAGSPAIASTARAIPPSSSTAVLSNVTPRDCVAASSTSQYCPVWVLGLNKAATRASPGATSFKSSTERLRGLEVDDQLHPRDLLHRQ